MRGSTFVQSVATAALIVGVLVSNTAAQSRPTTQRVPNSPGTAVIKLYTALIKQKVTGLPTTKQRTSIWPLLTEDLKALLDAAQREQDAFIKANPDEKPPLIEGDLFSSLFEGVQTFELGQTSLVDRRAHVPVTFSYTSDGKTTRWTDEVILAKSGGAWKIWDVRYNATWDFKPGTNLRAVLGAKDAP
ncbi:MAG: hypothetical protein IPF53_19600 [Blastocatellia bacterium]|nr:hypothetical protein [Blastocatellia bacterium]MBK6425494.1 hypothetical protein [Blastocatellia bacterium]